MTEFLPALVLWIAGSVVILWRTSFIVLKHGLALSFFTFFIIAMMMNFIAASMHYSAWTTDVWVATRFIWLAIFFFFFMVWLSMIRKYQKNKNK